MRAMPKETRVTNLLELEFGAGVDCLTEVLRTKLWSPGRAANILNP